MFAAPSLFVFIPYKISNSSNWLLYLNDPPKMVYCSSELSETNNKKLKKKLNHAAVSIEEAKQAITEGTPSEIITDEKGRKSQRFVGNKCVVTFNPDTQELIQTNRKR